MSNITSSIEIKNVSNLIKLGDLVIYEVDDIKEVVLVISNVDKCGNFKGIMLYNSENLIADKIGITLHCHIDNYTKFSGKIILESK